MDSETVKLLITTCGGPTILALVASAAGAVWYIVKIRAIGTEKRTEQGYTYDLAKEASVRAFGEGVQTREAAQLNDITSAALKQIYGLTDGTLTRMAEDIRKGNVEQALQDARILGEMSANQAIMAAALNKTIEQQAKILVALLDLLGHSSDSAGFEAAAEITKKILAGLTSATITSNPVRDANNIATAAVTSEVESGEETGDITIAVTGPAVTGPVEKGE